MRATLIGFFGAARAPEVLAAFLFGSYARGSAHAQSDLDVAVLLDRRLLPARAARAAFAERLASDLIGATHCNAVDVVVLNDAPPELAVAAVDAGEPLFQADKGVARAFIRTARLRLADLRPFLDRTRLAKLEAVVR